MREENVRPDFARGVDDGEGEETRQPRRFSEGQETERSDHEKVHEGTYGEGQADDERHPEGALHGRFSRGQEEAPADQPER